MQIILRRKDSVTSAVLFIYNIFREHTGKCSIPLDKLLVFMHQFDKSETATRMGLSRMVKAGILENQRINEEVYYQLTDFGLENINLWNTGISRFFERYKKRQQEWEGKWYAVTFLNLSRSDKEHQPLIDGLIEMGLREINRNIWVSPYRLSTEVRELAVQYKIRYVELYGGAEYNFSSAELLNDVFEIGMVRKRYSEFSCLMQRIIRELEGRNGDRERCLPMLFQLGWNFYDAAVSDPALPKGLLQDWEGDRVVGAFTEMRKTLYTEVVRYVDEVLAQTT